jgi:A/G-specific adenine glycosylase
LMDYGVFLKKSVVNPSRASSHHTVQSKFEGSDRQIRGKIIRVLLEKDVIEINDLLIKINDEPQRIQSIIDQLIKDEMIILDDTLLKLKS